MVTSGTEGAAGLRVVVVGAGAVGLFSALALCARGAAVTLVEADAAAARSKRGARAASIAAAGMLGGYSETLYEGPSTHRLLSKLCAAALAEWDRLMAATPGLAAVSRRTGALLLAQTDAELARIMRVRDRAKAHGAKTIWADALPPELDPHLYSLRVRGALELPQEWLIDPVDGVQTLEEMLLAAGGSYLRGRAVSHLAVRGDRVRGVALDDGSGLVADAVVLTPGARASPELIAVAPALQRLTPAKGILGVVEPTVSPLISHTVRTMNVYAVPGRLGEIIFGSTMLVGQADTDPDPDALAALFAALRKALPGARFEGPPRALAVGVRPMSPDWAPLVGPSGPAGCYVSCGHSRNGWLLAPLTAQMLAAQMFDDPLQDLWSAFLPDRFEKKAA